MSDSKNVKPLYMVSNLRELLSMDYVVDNFPEGKLENLEAGLKIMEGMASICNEMSIAAVALKLANEDNPGGNPMLEAANLMKLMQDKEGQKVLVALCNRLTLASPEQLSQDFNERVGGVLRGNGH